MRFDVHFKQSNQRIAVSFQNNSKVLGADFKSFQRVTVQPDVEHYTGDYSVIPKTDSQVLPTKDRFLMEDVEIVAIPYFDVSNNSGGTTVYIGSVEEMKN